MTEEGARPEPASGSLPEDFRYERVDGWWRRWARYGTCWYCAADPGEPCEDRRWDGRHPRWCRHPHPERRHRHRLLSWEDVDESRPYPWHDVDCPDCGEPELARDVTRPFTGFVCMACGARTTLEAR